MRSGGCSLRGRVFGLDDVIGGSCACSQNDVRATVVGYRGTGHDRTDHCGASCREKRRVGGAAIRLAANNLIRVISGRSEAFLAVRATRRHHDSPCTIPAGA